MDDRSAKPATRRMALHLRLVRLVGDEGAGVPAPPPPSAPMTPLPAADLRRVIGPGFQATRLPDED